MAVLLIEAHGGLGDQVCTEPIIRFIKKMWPQYDIHLITHHPELFQHLDIKTHSQSVYFEEQILKACTHPKDYNAIDFQQIHTIDYISLLLLKMTLPLKDKQIVIKPPQEAYNKIETLLPSYKVTAILHPGKSWDNKTFSRELWQSYIDMLIEYRYTVAVIGKNYWANKREYRGVVDGLDLSKCIDLVNQLSLMETCAALDMCPILVSNDSGPIHLSGAFNNHVGVISTVRRPETLFHWRNGIQGHRYYSLEKERVYDKLIPDTIAGQLTYNTLLNIESALPTANDILTFVGGHI